MEPSCTSFQKSEEHTRVFIWCVPRTLSTALTKCLSYVDGIQVFSEPCGSAFHLGPEGRTPHSDAAKFIDSASANDQVTFDRAFDDSKCTYGWIRQQLEADYPGKKNILVKDMAFYLDAKYDTIPPGYRHAFMIRHPYKVYPSWKRVLTKILCKDYDTTTWNDLVTICDYGNAYEAQFELLKFVQENLDPNPVIIDADDLQSSPSSILRQLCQAVGIPYSDSLLEWPADRDIMKTWIGSRIILQGNMLENEGGFYENALRSGNFVPGKPTPKRRELPPDIQQVSDYSMQFYHKMYQMRLKP